MPSTNLNINVNLLNIYQIIKLKMIDCAAKLSRSTF